MDLFLKIVLLVFGLFFVFVGGRMVFTTKTVIQGIQKFKYKTTSEPRKPEMLFARILGGLMMLAGLYYSVLAIATMFS
ncbi:MAG: hypothetical protein PHP32_03340 [Candidatus Izemoplasmatales bacterium]|nr:hypothetical protein [Candidatus Izemoplasmatales bacterium]